MDLLFRRPKKDRNAMGKICLRGEGIVIGMRNLFILEMKRFLPSRPLCIRRIRRTIRNGGEIDGVDMNHNHFWIC